MNIDDLFQKINKEIYEPKDHKDKLRAALLNNKYFVPKESNRWNFNLAIPSLSLSLTIFVFISAYILIPKTTTYELTFGEQKQTLYNRLSKNNNTAKIMDQNGMKGLEVSQENTKTTFYFNHKNILIGSGVHNKQ